MNSCQNCSKPIDDKRRKYCTEMCKSEFYRANGKTPRKSKKSEKNSEGWSLETAEEKESVPTSGELLSGNTYRMSEMEQTGHVSQEEIAQLRKEKYNELNINDEDDDVEMPPRKKNGVETHSHARSSPVETYNQRIADKKVWIPGQSWIEVLRFHGDFEGDFDGDLTSVDWIPAMGRILDPPPTGDELVEVLQSEYGGGTYQVRFLQSGIHSSRKATPPILIQIDDGYEEDDDFDYERPPPRPHPRRHEMPTRRRDPGLDPTQIWQSERDRAHRYQQQLRKESEDQRTKEKDVSERVFEMQDRILDDKSKEKDKLEHEIHSLRQKGPTKEIIELMQRQNELQREDLHQMRMKSEQMSRASQEKDQTLFTLMLDHQKDQEEQRRAENKKQEESHVRFAELIANRDQQSNSTSSDTMQIMMKSTEMMMLQMQQQNQQQMAQMQNQQAENMKLMAMIMDTKSNNGDDMMTQFLLTQQENTRASLEESRRENNNLMHSMIEQKQGTGGLKDVVETAKLFNEAKEAFGAGESEGSSKAEDEEEEKGFFAKAQKIAEAFNVGALTDALGQRISQGQNPQMQQQMAQAAPPPPPRADPPAQPPRPRRQPRLPPQQQMQMQQQQMQQQQMQQQMPPQQMPPPPPELQGNTPPETPPEESVDISQVMMAIEQSIVEGVSPKEFVAVITPEQRAQIQLVPQDILVKTVQDVAQGAMTKSFRGKKWLTEAKNLLYAS